VFAQNPEPFERGRSWYRPERWDRMLWAVGGWLPVEWIWYSARQGSEAICCGVLGGSDTSFLAYYARTAIRLIEHPRNQPVWQMLDDVTGDNILAEQYLLSACLHYHQQHLGTQFHDLRIGYVFASLAAATEPAAARRAGFTHLIGASKREPILAQRLERRVQRDYPVSYERLVRCCPGSPAPAMAGR
jgi:hypothetical protein